jgi:hypothetical protein
MTAPSHTSSYIRVSWNHSGTEEEQIATALAPASLTRPPEAAPSYLD